MKELVVIFESAPGPEPARFVEVEDTDTGHSVAIPWSKFGEKVWALGPFASWDEATAMVADNERLREALTTIARGTWTARNSVETIVYVAREALAKD